MKKYAYHKGVFDMNEAQETRMRELIARLNEASEAYYGGGNIEKDDIVIKKSGLDPEKYFEKLHEEHTK